MREWACVNGTLMPAEEARVSVFDSGFMQGVGLFETMRAYGGRVFRLERHMERLRNSAATLGWAVLPDVGEMTNGVRQVAQASGGGDLRVRVTVTTGTLRVTEREQPELTIVVTAGGGGKYPDEFYTRGATLALSPYRQSRFDPTVGHKTTSYFSRLASLREAHARGAVEALWLTDDGHVAEGAISSLFIVSGGELLTPPLDTPVLPGITRAAVLELAREQGVVAHERSLTLDDVRAAEEVFVTNSMMELLPIVRLERERIGDEKPGRLTRQLAIAYGYLLDRECGDA